MADVNIVKIDGKPIEKLIGTVSAGIGVLYKPRAIRNEADAEAYKIETIANAKAKASLIRADVEGEIAERAKHRLYYQEMQRQVNIDNVVENSTKYLKDNVSEEPVDEDWRTKFFNKAQDVTSEELQEIWAKILANEVNQPGEISVRTLDILSNMSKNEANLFEKISSISTVFGSIIKISENDLTEFDLKYDDLSILRAAGLLLPSDTMNITFKSISKIKEDINLGAFLNYNSPLIFISKVNTPSIVFNQFKLTLAGTELLPIIGKLRNLNYINALVKWLKAQGYEVVQFNTVE